MKICVVSDLHFEINGYPPGSRYLKEGGDVLIVAGDLTCASIYKREDRDAMKRRGDVSKFLQHWASKFRRVYYVLGNHDHYYGIITETLDIMKNVFKDTNVRVLEDEAEEFDGFLFYGATMWTSFNNGDPNEMATVGAFMNDYNLIFRKHPDQLTYTERHHPSRHVNQGLILPINILELHYQSKAKMEKFFEENPDKKIVMITHHCPSYQCQNFDRHGNNLLHGYCNNFEPIIDKHDNIVLWAHGHSHDNTDFIINKTRIYSNQLGYLKYEPKAHLFKPTFIEI